jgi:hypothetical protein
MTPHETKAQECAEEIGAMLDLALELYRSNELVAFPQDYSIGQAILRHFPEPVEKACEWTPMIHHSPDTICVTGCDNSFGDRRGKTYCHHCGGKIKV